MPKQNHGDLRRKNHQDKVPYDWYIATKDCEPINQTHQTRLWDLIVVAGRMNNIK